MSVVVAVLGHTGRISLNVLYAVSRVCLLMVETFDWIVVRPLRGQGLRVRSTVLHLVEFGVNSFPVVGLVCILVGAIMAMQASYQLSRFGAQQFIADLVSVAAMRELAPLMTAVLVTGRCGSAIAAEIGSMRVAEEIDALEVMGINPIRFLVAPKFLAMLIAVPSLTVLATLVMIAGGYLLSTTVVGIDAGLYLERTANALQMKDFATGFVKSVFFAVVICWVGVYRGFQAEGGAEGVGRMTTSSVVTSIFWIVVVDMVFTVFFYFI
ncbi:MAG TPA: ABC transporter permease [Candidatus Hydrogenedentes bacterium]|nr:ABC transporter permease [Candidatus Hydrogenedentota bacterium]HQE82308.1 ABC transporter permease [Candidatus Hydrogenedentota bacterium]HQH69216.1 ABC transporter permease [Candidatus Hydrogenedentota bacterium]HQM48998.1 ABC transporter permease [Candidatus Hydrogenedentota bacterium]